MNENLVVRTTVDFIRSSPKNLDLALQIEEAMRSLKPDLIEEFLKSVETAISTDVWRLHRSDGDLFKKSAVLVLRKADWRSDEDPADLTGIVLGTDRMLWGKVYVGIYLSKMIRQRIKANERQLLHKLKGPWEELPQGKGWETRKFRQEHFDDDYGHATYRYLDEPVGDWGSAQFLRNSLDNDRKEEMVRHVVDRMEFLKRSTSELVEAILQTP